MMNACSGGITTLAHTSNLVFNDAGARELVLAMMAETASVGRAERHGIDVPLNRLVTTLIRLGEPPEVPPESRT